MAKFRTSILIIGMLVIVVAASLLTVLALYVTGAVVTERIELVYSVDDVKKEYDGTPLVAKSYELVSGELLNGHYAIVEFTGSQTDAGQSRSGLSVKICDQKGYDVTNEYKISVNSGLLNVLPREISVVLNDEEVTYNGSKITFDNYSITSGDLVKGHKITGAQTVQLINVDDGLPDDLSVVVFDMAGNDVTQNYDVDFNYNKSRIKVVKRPVTIKPVDKIKVYDGVEVDLNEVEILSGSLVEGQHFKHIEVSAEDGRERFIDACAPQVIRINGIKIIQTVGLKEIDVTSNYELDISETGILSIEKRPLRIVARSGSWEYDGTDHYITDRTPLSCEGLAPGEELLSVQYSGTVRNVNEENSDNVITGWELSDGASKDNYAVTLVSGTLLITRREVTIITPTLSKTYDGEPLYGASLNEKPLGMNLATNHTIKYNPDDLRSITDCDTVSNQFKYTIVDGSDATETDLSANYKITPVYGTLTVTKRIAQVITPTVTEEYNGKKHYGYTNMNEDLDTYNFVGGHLLGLLDGEEQPELKDVGMIRNMFKVAVYFLTDDKEAGGTEITLDNGTKIYKVDVTNNYEISYQYGDLIVTTLKVKIKTGSYNEQYDGQEHQIDDRYTEKEGLPENFVAEPADGQEFKKVKNVCSEENSVLYVLKFNDDGQIVDVDPNNYVIEYDYGPLEVTPYEFDVDLKTDFEKVYDSKKFEIARDEAFEKITFDEVLLKDYLDIVYEEMVDAGRYFYTVAVKPEYNPDNYNLNITLGEVVISECGVYISLKNYEDDDKLIYSAEEWSADCDEVITSLRREDGLIGLAYFNKGLFHIVSDVIKYVGEYTYTVAFNNESDDKNHILYITGGNITVAKKELDLHSLPVADLEEEENVYQYNAKAQFPALEDIIKVNYLANGLEPSDFEIVPLNGEAINASEVPYRYTVQLKDRTEAENYDIEVTEGSVIIIKCKLVIELYSNTTTIRYDGLSHRPKIQDAILSDLPEYLRYSLFEIVTDDDMKSAGTHAYTVALRNIDDADNHELIFVDKDGDPINNGKITIEKRDVYITLKPFKEQYTSEEQKISLYEALQEYDYHDKGLEKIEHRLITAGNLHKYLEIYTSDTIKDAKTYTYGVRFIYREDDENYRLLIRIQKEDEEDEPEEEPQYEENGVEKYEVTKIKVTLKSTVADYAKPYDGKVYTVDTADAIESNLLRLMYKDGDSEPVKFDLFEYTFSATCQSTDSFCDTHKMSYTDVRIFNIYGENITRNFDIENKDTVTVVIYEREITFTLANYFCSKGNEPRTGSSELIGCLGVSSATPLLSGYTVDFEDVYIQVIGTTLNVYDFSAVRIYNEDGEDVTINFNITNGRTTSEIIAV